MIVDQLDQDTAVPIAKASEGPWISREEIYMIFCTRSRQHFALSRSHYRHRAIVDVAEITGFSEDAIEYAVYKSEHRAA